MTGRPVSWQRDEPSMSWYALTLAYTAAKWPYASPNHRRGIAEALTDATEAMLVGEDHRHPRGEIHRALRTWAYSDRLRGTNQPAEAVAPIIRWLETATIPVRPQRRRAAARLRQVHRGTAGRGEEANPRSNPAGRARRQTTARRQSRPGGRRGAADIAAAARGPRPRRTWHVLAQPAVHARREPHTAA